jgi:hypothetical protein
MLEIAALASALHVRGKALRIYLLVTLRTIPLRPAPFAEHLSVAFKVKDFFVSWLVEYRVSKSC